MLRLLCFGLRAKPDHAVYRRRHVYELLMSFYDAAYADTFTRKVILQLFVHAVSIRACLVELVRDKGLLAWLQRNATRANAPSVLAEACANLMTLAIANFPLHSYPFLLPTFVAASSALLHHVVQLLTAQGRTKSSPRTDAPQLGAGRSAVVGEGCSASLLTHALAYAVVVARRTTDVDGYAAAAALHCTIARDLFRLVTARLSEAKTGTDATLDLAQSDRLLAELMMTLTLTRSLGAIAPTLTPSALEQSTQRFRFLAAIVQWVVHLIVTGGSALVDLTALTQLGSRYEIASTLTPIGAAVPSHVRPANVRVRVAL